MSLRAKCQDLKCQDHMSWAREEGVLLVGGTENSDTEAPSAEFVSWDGKRSEVMFNLSVIHRSVWYSVVHLVVEDFSEELLWCLLCHKEPARRIQSPQLGALSLLLAGSLWHKDSWLPCTERSYYRRPYAIKNQRGASKKPLVGGFLRSKAPSRGLWMRGAGSLWHKRHCSNSSEKSSTSRWTTLEERQKNGTD